MAEEKKATVNVICTLTAKVAYRMQSDNDIVKVTFNMSDVPVDATDDQVKFAAVDAIAKDFGRERGTGTGIIRAVDTEGDKACFIAINSIKKFVILDTEIKRGE